MLQLPSFNCSLFLLFLLLPHIHCSETRKAQNGQSSSGFVPLRNKDKPIVPAVSTESDTTISKSTEVLQIKNNSKSESKPISPLPDFNINNNDPTLVDEDKSIALESPKPINITEALQDIHIEEEDEEEIHDEKTVEIEDLLSTENSQVSNDESFQFSNEEEVIQDTPNPDLQDSLPKDENGGKHQDLEDIAKNVSAIAENATSTTTDSKEPLENLAPVHNMKVSKPKVPPAEMQFIYQCGCRRKFFYNLEGFTESKLNSSCSDEGTHHVPGQKVVSFSLSRASGQPNVTGANIRENLLRMRHFYPNYSMRLYTDLSLDENYCRLVCQNVDLFWCDIRNSIGDQSKMVQSTWKFLPLGDPSVELFLSRDLGSLITEREAAAVDDWLQLNKTFHLMRDKRRVHNIPIVGGLWGARNDLFEGDEGDKLRTQIISLSKTPRSKGYRAKNFDQDILSRVIFYPRKKDIVAYDSYHCKQWKKYTMVRPFPVRRNYTTTHTVKIDGLQLRGAAASAVAAIKKKYKLTKCPIECRPSYGKDWEYC